MEKLYGFIESDEDGKEKYRFKVEGPTTIFESRSARLTVYKGSGYGKRIGEMRVNLEEMPYWDNCAQVVRLRREDQAKVRRAMDRFVTKFW